MALKFFAISVHDEGSGEAALNGFLASHRIVTVERRLVDVGAASYWAICVDYLPSSAGKTSDRRPGRGKIDYKEVLSPPDFACFSRLRQLRQELSQRDAVPVYAIFNNEQLAEIAKRRPTSRTAFDAILGVGDARIEKYADAVIGIVVACEGADHAASRGTV